MCMCIQTAASTMMMVVMMTMMVLVTILATSPLAPTRPPFSSRASSGASSGGQWEGREVPLPVNGTSTLPYRPTRNKPRVEGQPGSVASHSCQNPAGVNGQRRETMCVWPGAPFPPIMCTGPSARSCEVSLMSSFRRSANHDCSELSTSGDVPGGPMLCTLYRWPDHCAIYAVVDNNVAKRFQCGTCIPAASTAV